MGAGREQRSFVPKRLLGSQGIEVQEGRDQAISIPNVFCVKRTGGCVLIVARFADFIIVF